MKSLNFNIKNDIRSHKDGFLFDNFRRTLWISIHDSLWDSLRDSLSDNIDEES